MDFSLSSSLVGNAVSNPDKLALDLQFATDKTLTARKGPTPVFTRGSTGRFVGSDGLIQSAAINIPRFDHDPITGICKGLLMEESRTNSILQNENFGTTWQASQLNVTGTPAYLNTAVAPTGLTTADKLIANTTTATHQFRQDVTLVAASIYTVSCYFKAAEHITVSIAMVGSGTGGIDWSAFYNVSTGVKTGVVTGFSSSEITNAGNGWYRCSVTFTAVNSGATNVRFGGANTAGNSSFYTGDNSGGFFLWGAQVELGSFATSYIPTTTASVIRSTDVCSISGSDFSSFYNPIEGSFAASSIFNAPNISSQGQIVFDVNDTTSNNRVRVFRYNNTSLIGFNNTIGGSNDALITGSTPIIAGSVVKLANCIKSNDFAIYLNGVLQGTDTSVTLASTFTTLTIGEVASGVVGKLPLNGTINYLRYYKKRLPDLKLQAFTV